MQTIHHWFKIVLIFVALVYSTAAFSQEFSDGHISVNVVYPTAASPGDTLPVKVHVFNGKIEGFAKYQAPLPAGYSIQCGDIENAASTTKNDKFTILWVSMPADEFIFNYSVIIPATAPKAEQGFSGSFFYILDKNTRELKLPNLKLNITDSKTEIADAKTKFDTKQLANSEPKEPSSIEDVKHWGNNAPESQASSDSVKKPLVLNNLSNELPSKSEGSEENNNPKEKHEKKGKTDANELSSNLKPEPKPEPKTQTHIPQPVADGGGVIVFKVQVAASKSTLSSSEISKLYSGAMPVNEFQSADGLKKYLIGSFSSYEEASRSKQSCGVEGAFVVAFRENMPISIVDALRGTINKPNEGVGQTFYAVQVIATKRYLSNKKMAKKFEVDNISFVEKENDVYKYMVGFFTTYQEAVDFRTTLQTGDSFVVAYRNGERQDISLRKQ